MKHPHADEHRRRSPAEQLEGTSLWAHGNTPAVRPYPGTAEDDLATLPKPGTPPTTKRGPHRVGRRTMTQDAAHHVAKVKAPTKRQQVLDWLRDPSRKGRGFTREQIAAGTNMKLQTVCGRVNELLGWEVGGLPTPLVYESGSMNGANLVFAHDNAERHRC